MNFKEALIAHLQGEKVEVRNTISNKPWSSFLAYHGQVCLYHIDDPDFAGACEFRLAPRTIFVNGVEVPAPESVAPKRGSDYFVADPTVRDLARNFDWDAQACDFTFFERGLVYLNKKDAIARAKAMLLTSDK